jgi:cell volume regulation protein A
MLHMTSWESAITVLLIVFGGGLIVGKLTDKPKIPDVAAYLLLGLVLGPAGLNWIAEPAQSEVNQFILNVGATLILFDGGRAVEFSVLRQVWLSVVLLATLGVLVSAVVVGAAAHFLFGTPWLVSLLIAAVIASTDPATLIPVFKRVRILPRLQQTVESESAFNDATASVLVFTLLGLLAAAGSVHWYTPIVDFVRSSVLGLAVGLVCGLLALWLVSDKGWGIFQDYGSIVMFVIAIGSFQFAEAVHASGLMAAFTAGVVSGNGKSFGWPLAEHTEANVHHFGNAVTLLLRMMIFVFLGTQVDFTVVREYFSVGVLLVFVLMFVARPLTVLSSVLVDRRANWSWREVLFMFWTRETGVIPAALAGMITAERLPGAEMIGAVTFLAILVTIVLQASTTPLVAKRLGVAVSGEEEDV